LEYPENRFEALMAENPATLGEQVHSNDEFFAALGDKFPPALKAEERTILRHLG
jgi:hypothetical protein